MFMKRAPIIMTGDNGDGTQEVVAGSHYPFNMVVKQNDETSVIPAERDKYGFYLVGMTLPSNVEVRAS
jgi:hypothetical protein